MKKKITKIESAKDLRDRLQGLGKWRITGPSEQTGERKTIFYFGTRKEAEKVRLT